MDTLKLKIKQLLIEALALEDFTEADIGDDAPLFESDGIGLDSIDALEIGIALRKEFGITISGNDSNTHNYFRSVNTLAALVLSQQKSASDLKEIQG